MAREGRMRTLEGLPTYQWNRGIPAQSNGQTDPDPRLDVDLDLTDDETARDTDQDRRASNEDAQDATDADMATRDRAGGDPERVASGTEAEQSEPQVNIVDAEGKAKTSYDGGGEPTLSYDRAKPQVSVEMPKEPTVEVEQSGDPKVIVETPEEREKRRQQQDAAADDQRTGEDRNRRMAAADDDDETPATGMQTMTVGELMDMEVVTSNGEDLGAPEGFIEMNGETHLVLGSGGFLGMGEKEVPVRMSKVKVRDEELVVATMTEEDIEAANDFEYDESRELPDDHQVKLNRQ